MARAKLKNPPLIEVILEIRWELQKDRFGNLCDPYSTVLPGRIYDKLAKVYPEIEKLPSLNIPDEMSPYMVKQRFRKAENQWPLIQIGPGIFTCNHTSKYTSFDEFRPLAVNAINTLFEIYPGQMSVSDIILKYIDAVEFDFINGNIFTFLKDKMGVSIGLPDELFDKTDVDNKPSGFSWRSSYQCNKPLGLTTLGFASGQKNGKPALIWEHVVQSNKKDLEEILLPASFEKWLIDSHNITDEFFFNLIKGELEGVFNND